jgi:hypothetical protein
MVAIYYFKVRSRGHGATTDRENCCHNGCGIAGSAWRAARSMMAAGGPRSCLWVALETC